VRHTSHALGRAEDHRGQRDRVDPDIQQRAATQRGIEQAALRVEAGAKAKINLDHAHFADCLGRQQLAQPNHVRQKARPHRLHQKHAARPCGRDHRLGLASIDRERLLAQHRLAGFQAHERVIVMQRVRSRHIDRVDIGVTRQRRVAAMPARRAKSLAKRLGRLSRARPNRRQIGIVELGQPARKLAGNIAGAENTPACLGHCYLLRS
jgi:hypothetical protein